LNENSESGLVYFAFIVSLICTAKNIISLDLISFRDFLVGILTVAVFFGLQIILFASFTCFWSPFNGYLFIFILGLLYFYAFYKNLAFLSKSAIFALVYSFGIPLNSNFYFSP
jgi:hypothetical protein